MQWLSYIVSRSFIELFRLIPFWLLYCLSDGLAWVMSRTYRRKVVYGNLRRCYPDASAKEIDAIAKASYRNMTDVLLETIKSFTMPIQDVLARMDYGNVELINALLAAGKPIIISGGHLCNWEWIAATQGLTIDGPALAIYKKISNPYFERYVRKNRDRGKLLLYTMPETAEAVRQMAGQPFALILGSDQSPSNPNRAHWINFMGTPTAFLPGIAFLSKQYQMVVTYFVIHRVRRGYYRLHYEVLTPTSPDETAPTQVFAQRLEADIRSRPADWLWTHKRWKHTPPTA